MYIHVHVYFVGLKKGDRVAIYMPMIIELTVAMLACARLGIVHSIVVRFCRITIFLETVGFSRDESFLLISGFLLF